MTDDNYKAICWDNGFVEFDLKSSAQKSLTVGTT